MAGGQLEQLRHILHAAVSRKQGKGWRTEGGGREKGRRREKRSRGDEMGGEEGGEERREKGDKSKVKYVLT